MQITVMSYLFYLGNTISNRHAPLIDSILEIKIELTTAHLWFEEKISGDDSNKTNRIWVHLDQAKKFTDIILNGGEHEETKLDPASHKELVVKLNEINPLIDQFKLIAEKRLDNLELSQPGSDLDQEFDSIFHILIQKTEYIENKIHSIIRHEKRQFKLTSLGLIIFTFLMFILIGYFYNVKENEANELVESLSELNEELLVAKDLAIKANEHKSQFIANMSHELRTPMHAIIGFTDIIFKRIEDEKSRHFLENIKVSSTRLIGLINKLLDLTKLQAGKMDMNFTQESLTSVTSGCITQLESLFHKKSINIEFNSKDQFEAFFDCNFITQVIVNLLSNAIKFSPENSVITIEIKVIHSKFNGGLELSVTDQGVGIPKDELSSVFDPFVQSTTTTTKAGGTGLGLPICQEIINEHKGIIWAESPAGKSDLGSSFHFIIPIKQSIDNLI